MLRLGRDAFEVLHTVDGAQVLNLSQWIDFRDGTTAVLHSVRAGTSADAWLRAVQTDERDIGTGPWAVFDVRHVLPRTFEAELRRMPCRDYRGMELYTLRQTFRNRTEFLTAVREHAINQHRTTSHETTHVAA
ncbi:MAG: hypothetical protein RJA98_3826 [Pseudomonadota bacterium]|jgi:hypothetical protein